jgi:hypothetical protein
MTVANSIGSGQTLGTGSSPTFANLTLSGTFTDSLLPCFFAYANANITNVTGDGTTYTTVFNTEMFDLANNFDGTSTFTAPITGNYLFSVNISLSNLSASHTITFSSLVLAGSASVSQEFNNMNAANCRDASNNFTYSGIIGPIKMVANDTAKIQLTVSNGTKTVTFVGAALTSRQSTFSAFLVC